MKEVIKFKIGIHNAKSIWKWNWKTNTWFLKKVKTKHDKSLPCKMSILQWRKQQIKEIINH